MWGIPRDRVDGYRAFRKENPERRAEPIQRSLSKVGVSPPVYYTTHAKKLLGDHNLLQI